MIDRDWSSRAIGKSDGCRFLQPKLFSGFDLIVILGVYKGPAFPSLDGIFHKGLESLGEQGLRCLIFGARTRSWVI